MTGEEAAQYFRDTVGGIRREIGRVVVGQEETVLGALTGLAVGGHILLEGAPGLGKTLLVRSLSQAVDLQFSRIQFTPDLMPADITGTNVLAEAEGGRREFIFRQGPIFTNILLADEINRATPKTQSALLEGMQEGAVTVGGQRHGLPAPFLVMATQNPIEHEGTYVLPEAQLDRFLMKVLVPYPTVKELAGIAERTTGAETQSAQKAADRDAVVKLQQIVREVPLAATVRDYILTLIVATHPGSEEAPAQTNRYVRYGSSPRGMQAMILAAKVAALMAGRFNVAKDDARQVAAACLRHRVILNYEAEADGMTPDKLIGTLLSHVDSKDREPVRV
ncbi:MAG TPA: MoxR family ATPase [Capsulimonadaceae bacterium]|nr:MoxR family ATPase [Capsulimonadaceae bacterium]